MTILYGFNILLKDIFKIKFPCSVLGMLINLIFLCILSYLSEFKRVVVVVVVVVIMKKKKTVIQGYTLDIYEMDQIGS